MKKRYDLRRVEKERRGGAKNKLKGESFMAKNQLAYERVTLSIVTWSATDVITTSIITDNAEDTEKDFFAPLEF